MPEESLDAWLAKLGPPADFRKLTACETGSSNSVDTNLGGTSAAVPKVRERLLLSIARSAMACEFEVLLNQHQYPQAPDEAVAALELIEQLESLLSVYKPRSELSILNRFGSERQVAVSFDTANLLRLASDVYRFTGGAFDLTASVLSDAWGFSRRQGRKPDAATIAAALENVGSEYLSVDAEAGTAGFSRPGVQVNPGGIGKGYALDRAAGRLSAGGVDDFMLHGGLSSVVARGDRQHPQTGGGWLVSLKHPWRHEEHMGTIRLQNQALGTSGSGKQFFHIGGQRYSHIIDPRSGQPAQGMMSATVVCASGAVSDALATALFVMGVDAAREFCSQYPQIGAILVYQASKSSKQQLLTMNLPEGCWSPAIAD